jgi:hypothetical protein
MSAQTVMPRDQLAQALTAALAAPFEPAEIKFKPQMVKNNSCLAMAYIDARLIQDRLDEVLGVENWEDAYRILPDGSVMCRLRCKIGDRWITKTDVGSPSEQPDGGDRLKAAFSDALKRAAVKFGIGRYLYRLQAQWVNYDPVKKKIMQRPEMPAFALPAGKAPPAPQTKALTPPARAQTEQAREVPNVAAPKSEPPKPANPKPDQPKAEVGKADQPKPSGLPANGQELHRRLREYDAKLAAQKLCRVGALLDHVTQAGVKAGFTANMSDWTGTAIPFAADAVKEFVHSLNAGKPEPRTAA